MRTESDSLGPVEIAEDRLWGAQTQRTLANFAIGGSRYRWSRPVIEALGRVKKAAAIANAQSNLLSDDIAQLIIRSADEVIEGKLDDQFPLGVWQSGSGTQTNMNANEVIANRANELAGGEVGAKNPVHPNDHVNLSQSSNDVFPTVMHLTIRLAILDRLIPELESLRGTVAAKRDQFAEVIKVGRTHLQDAAPLTVGQEMSGWTAQLDGVTAGLRIAEAGLATLTIGGTAVGTGLNSPLGFSGEMVAHLSEQTGLEWLVTPNHFAGSSAHDAVVAASAALRSTAAALIKIGNDIRWLASGPRAGIGELILPANEPGSSIMPGKVNPTQIEALTMVAVHVFGNDAAVAFAGSQGSFQLNTYKPLMLYSTLDSIELLADAVRSFERLCMAGVDINRDRIDTNLANDLMLVTALAPHIGYEDAAHIAQDAERLDISLRQAAIDSGRLTADQFDAWVDPAAMTHPDLPPASD